GGSAAVFFFVPSGQQAAARPPSARRRLARRIRSITNGREQLLKAIGIIVVIVIVAIAAVLAYAATRPDTFRVQRSASISAPPEKVFALITDLRGWTAWSPYEKKDPAMKRTYAGNDKGKGAIYSWDGDKNVGAGRMEVIDVTPPSRVVIKLDFQRPF